MREAAHSHVAVGNRSLFLPGGDRDAASCSPLEGDCRLRAGKTTQPGPQGSGFFFSTVSLGEKPREPFERPDYVSPSFRCVMSVAPKKNRRARKFRRSRKVSV